MYGMLNTLRRRGWVVVVVTVLCASVAGLVAYVRPNTYSAKAVTVVARPGLPPDQANLLAVTYTDLIPKDVSLGAAVARSLHVRAIDVLRRVSVTNDPSTALLHLSYKGTSAANALAGATTVAKSISGPHPQSPNIRSGSLHVVQLPSTARSSKGMATLIFVGALLGLALGAVLVISWERADPRVNGLEDLADEVESPTSSFDASPESSSVALLERWRKLGSRAPTRVALLAASESLQPRVYDIAVDLALADETGKTEVDVDGAAWSDRAWWPLPLPAPSGSRPNQVLVAGGVPGGRSAGEGTALASDVTVLLVRQGSRRAEVGKAIEALRKFGVQPAWILFVSDAFLRRTGPYTSSDSKTADGVRGSLNGNGSTAPAPREPAAD
jgi:capsular polysaccharide biosynthesis protein